MSNLCSNKYHIHSYTFFSTMFYFYVIAIFEFSRLLFLNVTLQVIVFSSLICLFFYICVYIYIYMYIYIYVYIYAYMQYVYMQTNTPKHFFSFLPKKLICLSRIVSPKYMHIIILLNKILFTKIK
jgi:hypothetical protein